MTRHEQRHRNRISMRDAAQERDREIKAAEELHELRQICAAQVGLDLATVSLGPQFDPRSKHFRGLPASVVGRPDPELFGKEQHGRKVVSARGFDPRAFEFNTSVDYYSVPTEAW